MYILRRYTPYSVTCRSWISLASTSFGPARPQERDPTQVDLLKRRLAQEKLQKKPGEFWYEDEFGGVKQRWNYRSEFVDRLGLDKPHTKIWLSFAIIIVIGFGLFVVVKSQVVEGRKEQMRERQRMRDQLKGAIGVVPE